MLNIQIKQLYKQNRKEKNEAVIAKINEFD